MSRKFLISLVVAVIAYVALVFGVENGRKPRPFVTISAELDKGSDPKALNASMLSAELLENTVDCVRRSSVREPLNSLQTAELLTGDSVHKYRYVDASCEPWLTKDHRLVDRFGNEFLITFDGQKVIVKVPGFGMAGVQSIDSNTPSFE